MSCNNYCVSHFGIISYRTEVNMFSSKKCRGSDAFYDFKKVASLPLFRQMQCEKHQYAPPAAHISVGNHQDRNALRVTKEPRILFTAFSVRSHQTSCNNYCVSHPGIISHRTEVNMLSSKKCRGSDPFYDFQKGRYFYRFFVKCNAKNTKTHQQSGAPQLQTAKIVMQKNQTEVLITACSVI